MPTKAKSARFTQKQRDDLEQYLLEKHELILKTNPNSSEVAAWATEVLKFHVVVADITRRVGPNGTLYKHRWPNTESAEKGRATSAMVANVLVMQCMALHAWASGLYNLLQSYGFNTLQPPPRMEELPALAAKARSGMAIFDHREEEEK